MPKINPSLEWIRDHRPAIHAAAKVFLASATQPPYQDACFDVGFDDDLRLEWVSSEDEKREIVIGCCLAFQCCGRTLEIGLLNKLILGATEFAAGVEIYPIVSELTDTGILCLHQPPGCQEIEDESEKEVEVNLSRQAFAFLSGLKFPSREQDEVSEPTVAAEKTATPILLLEVGRLLDKKCKSASWAHAHNQKKGLSKGDVQFIYGTITVLKKRLSSIGCSTVRILDADSLSVLMLAIFFEKRIAGRLVSLDDLLCVAQGDAEKELAVIRKIRNEFVTCGVAETFRCSQYELNEEIFAELLQLDDGNQEKQTWPDIRVYEHRLKPTLPQSSKPNPDDEDGPEGEFVWIAN